MEKFELEGNYYNLLLFLGVTLRVGGCALTLFFQKRSLNNAEPLTQQIGVNAFLDEISYPYYCLSSAKSYSYISFRSFTSFRKKI